MSMLMPFTPGPWSWREQSIRLMLAATHSGLLIVMDFVRRGMSGAQPRFAERSEADVGGLMLKATELNLAKCPDVLLIEAAADNGLLLRAILAGKARARTEMLLVYVTVGAITHACGLDLNGLPVLTDALRAKLQEALADSQ